MLRRLTIFVFATMSFLMGMTAPAFACCCVPHEVCELTGDC